MEPNTENDLEEIDPLDEIFTQKITIKELRELENKINEYRKLYTNAVLVREKQFIEIMNEREELLSLIIKLNEEIDKWKQNSKQEKN
jgi:hypothetical protein